MHNFVDLIYRSTVFTLNALNEIHLKTFDELQTCGSTSAIKNSQMIQLQKVILATGMFSIFEAVLQEGLSCSNGFEKAKKILMGSNTELYERFDFFESAINVLKHGRGRSYDSLVEKAGILPFRIKLPNEDSFFEGDVSEVSTLIEVDDNFVLNCAKLIEDVSREMRIACVDYCI